ncbi:MAG: nitrate reductase NapA [Planctomycetota bacterium]|jgi:nitrate reductase NapA
MTSLSRRQFLETLGVVGAGTMMTSCSDTDPEEASKILEGELTWGKAPCRYCGTGCGVEVGVSDGKVQAVRGDVKSPVNKGLLCAKGYHLPGFLYGEDRLTHPMRRQPDGSLKKISWDDALNLIAKEFQKNLDEHGPESVSIYGSGQWTVFDGYVATKWFRAGLQSNNVEPNARLCMASAVMGFMTQFGSDEPMGCYDDFEIGDDFILWGNNMAEMHPVLFSRILENKRNNPGVRIVDIGTRRTPTSDFADLYVEIKPGADLALANGILHLILKSNQIDESFINENVTFMRGIEDIKEIGFGCYGENAKNYTFKDKGRPSSLDELKKFVAEYTPEFVSGLTGVPEAQIKALAEMYGASDRGTISLWCMGVNQHTRGTWMNNLITDLHLITGKIGRPGANPFSLTGQPSACGTAREVGTLCNRLPADMLVTNPKHRAIAEKIWEVEPGTIPSKPGRHTIDMFRALTRGDIKCMWIQVTNPWVSLPNLNRFERKPGDGRFIVVSDIYPTPTTEVADLILPSAAWVEREGVFGNSERRSQQWNKLADPPGEAKEDAWQMMEVAKRMGMGNLFPWPEDNWHEPMWEEYRRFGLGSGKDLASYAQLKEERGMRWPVVDGKETRYRYAFGHDPYVKKTKGVHFYRAKKFGEKAAFWLRPYHPPAESPDEGFPFWMTTGRVLEHWHTGSMTRRVKELHQAVPEAYAEINRADAEKLGINDGETIAVSSRRGRIEVKAVIDGRGQPPAGTLFIPFFDEERLVNRLTLDAMCNISKEPDYKKCAVRVDKL